MTPKENGITNVAVRTGADVGALDNSTGRQRSSMAASDQREKGSSGVVRQGDSGDERIRHDAKADDGPDGALRYFMGLFRKPRKERRNARRCSADHWLDTIHENNRTIRRMLDEP